MNNNLEGNPQMIIVTLCRIQNQPLQMRLYIQKLEPKPNKYPSHDHLPLHHQKYHKMPIQNLDHGLIEVVLIPDPPLSPLRLRAAREGFQVRRFIVHILFFMRPTCIFFTLMRYKWQVRMHIDKILGLLQSQLVAFYRYE